jgi:hypothetical protein
MSMQLARCGPLPLVVLCLTLLEGCGEAVWNSLTDPELNIPFPIEGAWQGRFGMSAPPVDPCIVPGAAVNVEARGREVTGQVVRDNGQRLEVRGLALSGTAFTGPNEIAARIYLGSRPVGYLWLRGGSGPDQIQGRYSFQDLPPEPDYCEGAASLQRVAQ